MKSICEISILALMLFLGPMSCGILGTKESGGGAGDKRMAAEPNFDPLGFYGDDDVITRDVPEARDESDSGKGLEVPPTVSHARENDYYFSVQVFASKSRVEARDFMDSVEAAFDEEIRLEYQAPYYRVCVGQSQDIAGAEALLRKVSSMGFPKAWLVRLRR